MIINKEIEALKENKIKEELFISPFIEKDPSNIKYFNILNKLDIGETLVVQPVFAIRGSASGFEMYQLTVPSSVYWITPGIKIHSTIPLLKEFKSIWLYSWASFYKHSAYGFNNTQIYVNDNLFSYNPNHSSSFYKGTVSPKNGGMDFDQSEAGVSILSNNFEIVFGKFKTTLGPSSRSNLSLSNNIPPVEQVLLKLKHKKTNFTFLFGRLDSNIPLSIKSDSLFINQWEWVQNYNFDYQARLSEYDRYISIHRLDIIPISNLRIGLYETVIFGGRDIPIGYLIPLLPFWSTQHESRDIDNVMMGFDIDFIYNTNRIFFSLLLDEWAPYDTFDNDNRNWFAYQIGYSKYLKIFNKDCLIKAEYAKIDPRAYNHRFIINEPKHHGYNIGYWSGRNSDDIAISFSAILSQNSIFKLSYDYTRFPLDDYLKNLENQYNDISDSFFRQWKQL